MRTLIRPCLGTFVALTVLTGVVYPLVVTGIGKVVFPDQAAGSLILRDGQAVGSRLLGQTFSRPDYFWSRPSATAPQAYNAAASTGTNQAATHPALAEAVAARVAALRAADPGNPGPVPVDLVTASGSGLDPHISPAAAEYQLQRVARARHMAPAHVRRLVAEHTEGRTLGLLGEPRVNVLALNLALDSRHQGTPD